MQDGLHGSAILIFGFGQPALRHARLPRPGRRGAKIRAGSRFKFDYVSRLRRASPRPAPETHKHVASGSIGRSAPLGSAPHPAPRDPLAAPVGPARARSPAWPELRQTESWHRTGKQTPPPFPFSRPLGLAPGKASCAGDPLDMVGVRIGGCFRSQSEQREPCLSLAELVLSLAPVKAGLEDPHY